MLWCSQRRVLEVIMGLAGCIEAKKQRLGGSPAPGLRRILDECCFCKLLKCGNCAVGQNTNRRNSIFFYKLICMYIRAAHILCVYVGSFKPMVLLAGPAVLGNFLGYINSPHCEHPGGLAPG